MIRILLLSLIATLFSIFPLTDTDIWWHLACARETIAHGFKSEFSDLDRSAYTMRE